MGLHYVREHEAAKHRFHLLSLTAEGAKVSSAEAPNRGAMKSSERLSACCIPPALGLAVQLIVPRASSVLALPCHSTQSTQVSPPPTGNGLHPSVASSLVQLWGTLMPLGVGYGCGKVLKNCQYLSGY